MIRIRFDRARGIPRMLTVVCLVPLFILGMTSCAASSDETGGSAGSGFDSASTEGMNTEDVDTEGVDTEGVDTEDGESLDSLGSSVLLNMGLAGDIAVTCDHDDDGDLIGTVYLYGPHQHRLDTVNGEGVPTHIVADGGDGYVWNDDGEAGHYAGGEETRTDEDIEGIKAASPNCAPHGDLSVFGVPTDVDFVDVPTE